MRYQIAHFSFALKELSIDAIVIVVQTVEKRQQ